MKKLFAMAAIVAASMSLTGCGLGTASDTTSSTASSVGSSVLSGLLTNTTGSSTTGSLASTGLSLLSSLLGGNTVDSNTIVGTWTYQQPQVTFESSNVLSKLGGEVVGNKIESALSTQLTKIGLKSGVSKFTFDESGNVTVAMGSKTTTGTYTLSGNTLTMKGALGLTTITCTVSIQSNQLYMLFNASTLFSALTKLGSSSSTISSLMSNYNGMKLGWSCTK